MKVPFSLAASMLLIAVASLSAEDSATEGVRPKVQAAWSTQAVVVDGKLDEPVWKSAPSYPLAFSKATRELREGPQDPGKVQFAWDEEFFYAAFSFQDGDIVQESEKDQEHYYRSGDVAELFLKPVEDTWYWEMYATPNSLKTAFFFAGRGSMSLPGNFSYRSGLKTGATIDGTLNKWRDNDTGWVAEMAVPRKELGDVGIPLAPEHRWRIFVGRYNMSRYLPFQELSMMPAQKEDNYHLYEGWADLELLPPASQ